MIIYLVCYDYPKCGVMNETEAAYKNLEKARKKLIWCRKTDPALTWYIKEVRAINM